MQKLVLVLRSKMPVLAAVATVALILSIGTHARGNLHDAWLMLYIPSTYPLFADTRTITHSIDCLLSGQDPYIVRSFDPWSRVYNYPPIWLKARYLGITSRSTNAVATIFALSTVFASLLLFRAKTWVGAVIIFFAVASRPVLLAVERGNNDQVIFASLVVGFFLIEHQGPRLKSLFTGLLIVLLTILKIYPVVAAAVFLRKRSGLLKALITGTLSIIALVLTSGSRLPLVFANTPRNSYLSFGAFPFFLTISEHFFRFATSPIMGRRIIVTVGAAILASLSIVMGTIYRGQLNRFLPQLDFEDARGRIAISCLAIFCFSFILGASYDYRLIFLLGILAYLVEDVNEGVSLRSLPAVVVILLFASKPPRLALSFELLDGLVFVMASAWLGSTVWQRMKARHF